MDSTDEKDYKIEIRDKSWLLSLFLDESVFSSEIPVIVINNA